MKSLITNLKRSNVPIHNVVGKRIYFGVVDNTSFYLDFGRDCCTLFKWEILKDKVEVLFKGTPDQVLKAVKGEQAKCLKCG